MKAIFHIIIIKFIFFLHFVSLVVPSLHLDKRDRNVQKEGLLSKRQLVRKSKLLEKT